MEFLSRLYNLRDKKNKFHIAIIEDGELVLSDQVALLDTPVIDKLKSIVHERDKLLVIPSAFLNSTVTESSQYFVLNTSTKFRTISKTIVSMTDGALILGESHSDNAVAIGDVVITIESKSIRLLPRTKN